MLLDTHVFIWFVAAPEKLRPTTIALLEDAGTYVFVSVASAWEMAIKQIVGKLKLSEPAEVWVPNALKTSELSLLEIDLRSVFRTASLPYHHRDPFDRLLVAQALEHGLSLCSNDERIGAYEVPIIRP